MIVDSEDLSLFNEIKDVGEIVVRVLWFNMTRSWSWIELKNFYSLTMAWLDRECKQLGRFFKDLQQDKVSHVARQYNPISLQYTSHAISIRI